MSGVWVKVHPDQVGGGGMEGVPDWAEVSLVDGATERIYVDNDGTTWHSYTWYTPTEVASSTSTTEIGSIRLTGEGLVSLLIVAGGGSGWSNSGGGGGGGVMGGLEALPGGIDLKVFVGSGTTSSSEPGGRSSIHDISMGGGFYRTPGSSGNGWPSTSNLTPGAGAGGSNTATEPGPGLFFDWVEGPSAGLVEYGKGGRRSTTNEGLFGEGGHYQPSTATGNANSGGRAGLVCVRVPQSFAKNAVVR